MSQMNLFTKDFVVLVKMSITNLTIILLIASSCPPLLYIDVISLQSRPLDHESINNWSDGEEGKMSEPI